MATEKPPPDRDRFGHGRPDQFGDDGRPMAAEAGVANAIGRSRRCRRMVGDDDRGSHSVRRFLPPEAQAEVDVGMAVRVIDGVEAACLVKVQAADVNNAR